MLGSIEECGRKSKRRDMLGQRVIGEEQFGEGTNRREG
jgi:hypothetical protein